MYTRVPLAFRVAPTSPKGLSPCVSLGLVRTGNAAVKTILRGEDANAAKPGPRLTAAKRRQIEAAEAYRKSHAGCTLHNACIRSFVAAKGGFKSGKAMYVVLRRQSSQDG